MFAAVSLGIFDRLDNGGSEAPILAHELGANADAIERVLNSCVAMGLIEKQGAVYSNSPAANIYLTRSSPNTLVGYILYSEPRALPALGKPGGRDSRRDESLAADLRR